MLKIEPGKNGLQFVQNWYGIPKLIKSNNEPQFQSASFQSFLMIDYCFHYVISGPKFAKSNGFIEAPFKITKQLL